MFVIFTILQLGVLLPAQERPQPRFNVRVDLVSLDVEVVDQKGDPVADLTPDDFVIKENGRPVKISNFARLEDRPVSLTLVLDTSAILREKISVAKQFISRLAHLLGREDEISLYTFDTRDAYLEQDFTRDRFPLMEALNNIDVPSRRKGVLLKSLFGQTPRTALAIDLALREARRGRNEKKAVLIISSRFKGLGPATVDHARESGITVLALSFGNKTNSLLDLGGDRISKRQILRESGGRQFSAEVEDIGGICRRIAYSLKNHYSLAYLTEVGPGSEKTRKVQVLTTGRDYLVYARRSYLPPK